MPYNPAKENVYYEKRNMVGLVGSALSVCLPEKG
jgi:hypothetical protein